MIELQGRCKRMSEHASDEWCLCLCCLDPSLPRIIHMGKKKKKAFPSQSRVLHMDLPHVFLCHLWHQGFSKSGMQGQTSVH